MSSRDGGFFRGAVVVAESAAPLSLLLRLGETLASCGWKEASSSSSSSSTPGDLFAAAMGSTKPSDSSARCGGGAGAENGSEPGSCEPSCL